LQDLHKEGVQADLIFLDPPYGDSVPFVEFSVFWNAILGIDASPDDDISVSDRSPKHESWERYRSELSAMFAGADRALKRSGHLLVTFNNNDAKAWQALYGEAQAARFGCDFAKYQLPAVVPAKAAFHPDGSYVGDVWAVFSCKDEAWTPSHDLKPVREALARVAAYRHGKVAVNLVRRTLAIAWLTNNIDASMIDQWPTLIDELFTDLGGHMMAFKSDLPKDVPHIEHHLSDLATEYLKSGPCTWLALYTEIAAQCADLGVPDATEVRQILGKRLVVSGKKILAIEEAKTGQMDLFN
jgi:hypothetical protein